MRGDWNSFSNFLVEGEAERFLWWKELKLITTYMTQQFQGKLEKYLLYIAKQWLMFTINF